MERFKLNEELADGFVLRAPPGHEPGKYEWRIATARLVQHAAEQQVLVDTEGDATLAFESSEGLTPPASWRSVRYRWLMYPLPNASLVIAGEHRDLDMLSSNRGKLGAMDVLREAVTAGNRIAAALDGLVDLSRPRMIAPLPGAVLTDAEALDNIALLLNAALWDADTTSAVAEAVRQTGRTVADVA